jgi:acetylornithine/succinyldiaminopimelate/putrescine aminotransferase
MSRLNNRQFFLQHLAQTSPKPIGLEVARAEGIYIHDTEGKAYIDLIAGFSVCNIGHSHPKVIAAIEQQIKQYMHVIVYGEFIQSPQVQYAKALLSLLPENLQSIYFTNSGAEAAEGAMKLAKRVTKRTRIVAFDGAYHGSTQGALSVMGDEYFRNAYRPLLPDVLHLRYNNMEDIDLIDHHVACVMVEPVQAETGITAASAAWLKALRIKCDALCILLIFDEIQSGFGRTGSLFAFEQYDVVPDILLTGKALGAGLPLGAFISSPAMMGTLTYDPVLGHITTFGGNPVACAAGKAGLEVLLESSWMDEVKAKEKFLVEVKPAAQLKKPEPPKRLTEKAVDELVLSGFDPKMGARPLQRKINDLIKVPLSKKILFDKVSTNSIIVADFLNKEFIFKILEHNDSTHRIDENGYIVLETPV